MQMYNTYILATQLYLIIKTWLFRGGVLDIIEQIHPPSSKGHKFILVVVSYFSKWIETAAFEEVTQNEVIDFLQEQIIHRFILEALTTDQGTMFMGQRMMEYAYSKRINNFHTLFA